MRRTLLAWVLATATVFLGAGAAQARPQCVAMDIPGFGPGGSLMCMGLTPDGEIAAAHKPDGGAWSAWSVLLGSVTGALNCYARGFLTSVDGASAPTRQASCIAAVADARLPVRQVTFSTPDQLRMYSLSNVADGSISSGSQV